MNLDAITSIIEMPLKALDWAVNNFILIIVIVGCGYMIYWVYKNKAWIANKIKGKKEPKEKNIDYYFSKYLKGGNNGTN